MSIHLIVTEPFNGYEKGSRITDEAAVKTALETHSGHVVKTAAVEAIEEPKEDPPAEPVSSSPASPPAARKPK